MKKESAMASPPCTICVNVVHKTTWSSSQNSASYSASSSLECKSWHQRVSKIHPRKCSDGTLIWTITAVFHALCNSLLNSRHKILRYIYVADVNALLNIPWTNTNHTNNLSEFGFSAESCLLGPSRDWFQRRGRWQKMGPRPPVLYGEDLRITNSRRARSRSRIPPAKAREGRSLHNDGNECLVLEYTGLQMRSLLPCKWKARNPKIMKLEQSTLLISLSFQTTFTELIGSEYHFW